MSIKINEQIAFLRKAKGVTQEELATALGVSGQAVSKWESALCCPDIMLLPDLARYFAVSIDELMGYKGADTSKDFALQLRTAIDGMETKEAFRFTLMMAYMLHAALFTKENHIRNSENMIEYAGKNEWGYSLVNLPEITTLMQEGAVFFSANQGKNLASNTRLRELCQMLKIFSDIHNMKTVSAVYELTLHDENLYTDLESIAEKCELPKDTVAFCIREALYPYLREKAKDDATCYRIDGKYMHLIPIFSALCHP